MALEEKARLAALERENAPLREENEIKKHSLLCTGSSPSEKYAWIHCMTGAHRIGVLLRVQDVRSSSYYHWRSHPDSSPDHPELRSRIRHHFNRSRCSYGHRWIRKELRYEVVRVGRKLVLRLIKEEGLEPSLALPQPYKHGIGGEHRVTKNRLRREFEVLRANRLWTSEIT